MANLIVIRLHPDKPIAGSDFTNFLNGLTITAYDLSTADTRVGTKVGDAAYVAPPDATTPWIPDPTTGIVQHFTTSSGLPPTSSQLEAVATVVIQVTLPAGYQEYVSPDLRIDIRRNGSTISDKSLYYDVAIASVGAIPTPDNFPGMVPVSLYLKL